ncbi:MAG: recombinase family protein [Firmicutes bacterium]|nr:recombinase family protein [Bacillota bacterium]
MTVGDGGCRSGGHLLVALYARLSVNESGERDQSLETQRRLLEEYAGENGLGRARFYTDNDVSGVYFDRPGLTRLIDDINSGLIGTVVVKDLSRLGRNNGETLLFLDYLQEKNVRLVSLSDGYDSFRDDDDTIGIRTWVNEYYARDISRKVRVNLKKKMRGGEFLGRPPFGYRKSILYKNRLEVDERYRDTIRNIFELYIGGWGYRALADYVQCTGVPTPGRDKGCTRVSGFSRWEGQHIRRIITNRVYCGDTVQGVSEKVSFKSRKTRRLPGERWIVVPDTHEPIVDRETFALAQRVRMKRWLEGGGRKSRISAGAHLFSGFLVCAACGSRHVYRKKGNRPGGYICGRYNRHGRRGCTSHHVAENRLISCLLEDLRAMAGSVSYHDQLNKRCREELLAGECRKAAVDKLDSKIERTKEYLAAAYLDKLKGVISEELFGQTSAALKWDVKSLSAQRDRLKAERMNLEQSNHNNKDIIVPGPETIEEIDVDREYLEKYLRVIIVLEEEEGINGLIAEEYGLTGGGLNPEEHQFPELVIVYNLAQFRG